MHWRDYVDEVLISEEALQARIAELGAQIGREYADKDLLLVCVLKGGVMFLTDLMRCIEVWNLIDLSELILIAALERKESREAHRRADYPYTNRLLEKLLIVKKKENEPVTEWREFN